MIHYNYNKTRCMMWCCYNFFIFFIKFSSQSFNFVLFYRVTRPLCQNKCRGVGTVPQHRYLQSHLRSQMEPALWSVSSINFFKLLYERYVKLCFSFPISLYFFVEHIKIGKINKNYLNSKFKLYLVLKITLLM